MVQDSDLVGHLQVGAICVAAEIVFIPAFLAPDFVLSTDSLCAFLLLNLVMLSLLFVFVLQTVKDFFLLGRGELFLCFNDHAQVLLRKPVTETSEHGVCVYVRVCVCVHVCERVCAYVHLCVNSQQIVQNTLHYTAGESLLLFASPSILVRCEFGIPAVFEQGWH